jgi:hypothetical protein
VVLDVVEYYILPNFILILKRFCKTKKHSHGILESNNLLIYKENLGIKRVFIIVMYINFFSKKFRLNN